MNFIRRLGLGLATFLFSSLLTIFALFISIFAVLDKPEPLLGALQKSGIYSALAPTVFDQQAKQQDGELALDNPAIRTAVIDAFPPSYLQATVETNVRSIYSWVHGKTAEPALSADLSVPRERFSKNIGEVVRQKLASIPACKNPVSPPTTPGEVLAMSCKPPGVPDAVIIERAEQQAATSSLFAGTAERAATLKGSDGRPITDNLQAVPRVHRYFVRSLVVIPVVLALCAAAIIFWSASKRRGAQSLGRILIINGIIGIILALGASWALSTASRFIIDQNSTLVAIQSKLLNAVQILGGQLRNWWLGITIVYVVLGIIALFAARAGQKSKAKHNQALNESMGYRNDVPAAGTKFDPHASVPTVFHEPTNSREAADPVQPRQKHDQ